MGSNRKNTMHNVGGNGKVVAPFELQKRRDVNVSPMRENG